MEEIIELEREIDSELNGRNPRSSTLEATLKTIIEIYSNFVSIYNIHHKEAPYTNKYDIQNPVNEQDLYTTIKKLSDNPKPLIFFDVMSSDSSYVYSRPSPQKSTKEPSEKPITHHYQNIRTSEVHVLKKETDRFLKGSFLEGRRRQRPP